MDHRRYDTGWNDTVYGIHTFTTSDRWATVLDWVKFCRGIAVGCNQTDYHRGCVAACDHYEENGEIERRRQLADVA